MTQLCPVRVCGCVFGGLGFRVAGRDTALSRACVSLCVYVCACDVTAISILSIYLSISLRPGYGATLLKSNRICLRGLTLRRVLAVTVYVCIYRERVCVCVRSLLDYVYTYNKFDNGFNTRPIHNLRMSRSTFRAGRRRIRKRGYLAPFSSSTRSKP